MESPIKPTEKSLEKKERRRLEKENEILKKVHAELLAQLIEKDKEASFDSLTDLMRRHPFEEEIKTYLDGFRDKESESEVAELSLVFFDIDHFGQFNKTWGEQVGDTVLKRVAEVIRQFTRGYDPTCRWGGEEMVLAMIGADEEQALHKAKLIIYEISRLDFSDIDPRLKDLNVTTSAGVASSRKFPEFESLLDAADEALRKSKTTGRNKVTAHSDILDKKI